MLGDELVVADVSNHRLACFGLGCTYRRAIGRRGTVPGIFHLPQDVKAARGLLLVAEARRVQVLTPAGVPQQVITPPGCGSLLGLCISLISDGQSTARVLVADSEVRQVHEFELSMRTYGLAF